MTTYSDYNPAGTVRTSFRAIAKHIPLLPDYFNHQWFEDYITDFLTKNIAENNGVISGCVISDGGSDDINTTAGEIFVDGNRVTVDAPGTFETTDDGWYVVYVTSAGAVIFGYLENSSVQGATTPADSILIGYGVLGEGVFQVYSFFNSPSNVPLSDSFENPLEATWGTSSQVTAGDADFYTDGSGNPLNKDANPYTIDEDSIIQIVHNVAATANILIKGGVKKLNFTMKPGLTLNMATHDLTIGESGDIIAGDVRITGTGNLIFDASYDGLNIEGTEFLIILGANYSGSYNLNGILYSNDQNLQTEAQIVHLVVLQANIDNYPNNSRFMYWNGSVFKQQDTTTTVNPADGAKIHFLGFDTLAANMDLSAYNKLRVTMDPSITLGNAAHELLFGDDCYIDIYIEKLKNITLGLRCYGFINKSPFPVDDVGITYKRDQVWQQKGSGSATDRRILQSPNKIKCHINNNLYELITQQEKDLNTSGNWDSAETGFAVASARAGKDFYIYVCEPPSGGTLIIVLSANSTYPSDYSATTSRKIGGFHCLCASVGIISDHGLTDYLQGDILPLSVWDLLHRSNSGNEGMVWDDRTRKWIDIYLQSGTGTSTASVHGGTITDTRTWMDHVDDLGAIKKHLLDDTEFQIIASGSNEETNIAGSADPGTTGGHSDTASRRMISNIGCEDCCGALWQWLKTSSARLDDGTAAGYYDLPGSKGSFYTYGNNKYGNTQLLAGGDWTYAADCGSRARSAGDYRWSADAAIGARGCAEPRIVHL